MSNDCLMMLVTSTPAAPIASIVRSISPYGESSGGDPDGVLLLVVLGGVEMTLSRSSVVVVRIELRRVVVV